MSLGGYRPELASQCKTPLEVRVDWHSLALHGEGKRHYPTARRAHERHEHPPSGMRGIAALSTRPPWRGHHSPISRRDLLRRGTHPRDDLALSARSRIGRGPLRKL